PRLKTCKKARSGRCPTQPGPSSSERRSRFKSRTAVASKRMDSQMGIPNFIGKDHCLALTNGNGKGCRRIAHLTQQRLEVAAECPVWPWPLYAREAEMPKWWQLNAWGRLGETALFDFRPNLL